MSRPKRTKVLVVDDDATTLSTIGIALECRGYEVILRGSAIGTSAAIYSEKPDVAVLDVEMPGLRGDKLAQLLIKNASGYSPKVVFHSSLPQAELDRLARDSNAAGAIHKADLQSFLASFEKLVGVDVRKR
jgi:DNA-binding response OmpR family regulator